jgi:hypothetical protein
MEQMRIDMENMELRERLTTYTTSNLHPANIYSSSMAHNNPGQYINNAYIDDMPNMHNIQSMQSAATMKQRAMPARREGFNSAELRKLEGFNSAELRKLGRLQTMPASATNFYSRLGSTCG